jgi:hypothetical protein
MKKEIKIKSVNYNNNKYQEKSQPLMPGILQKAKVSLSKN